MSDFITRLALELTELSERVSRLSDFLNTQEFHALEEEDRQLLVQQLEAMLPYGRALKARLVRAGGLDNAPAPAHAARRNQKLKEKDRECACERRNMATAKGHKYCRETTTNNYE